MRLLPTIFAPLVIAVALGLPTANAIDWQGGSGNWNASNTSPGWNGTFPNAVGAVANFPDVVTGTTTNTSGNITLGTISLTNNSNNGRTITLTAGNGITLNQDGAGGGSATISNTNTNTETGPKLFIGGGTFTLADVLLKKPTSGSPTADGAIRISSVIAGTGNITFNAI